MAGTALLVPAVVLVAEGIDKGIHGHGLYAPGATFEVIWGVLFNAATIPLYFVMSEHCYSAAPERERVRSGCHHVEYDLVPLLAPAIAIHVFSSYLIGHGIWSLTDGGRPPVTPVAAVTPSAVVLGLAGSF